MKKLFIVCLMLTACGPSNNSGSNPQPTASYQSCEQIPAGSAVTQNPCPGSAGTWNNYLVVMDSGGTVQSFQLWCGGTDADHPVDQAGYDAIISGTSSTDFKLDSDCASGSYIDGSGDKTFNIWQKQ